MAKPSAAIHTPRPSALRSSSSSTSSCSVTRSSVGSTSPSAAAAASKLPVAAATHRDSASNAKVVAKCLVYDDDYFTLPSAATLAPHPDAVPVDGLAPQEDDLAPLLELPDPDVVSGDTSVVSAAADDALTASADSCVTEVPARADSATDTEADADAALPEDISHALAELRGAGGLSPRSKRLLIALAEAAALELAASAAAAATTAQRLRLRRASFWGKVRVAVLAAVAVADVALAAYLYARRANGWYGHALLPPT
ncbi:unnamed protein product [Miscanthus lutarioriparius]|uniref:Uncharacterized protein n=1 Tax=Miscanthus lutarioriparius TaxID=422564 RepID=A0A811PCH9_9POAL|nr:unnamed protein product [Miscanthus lutarioriparius]